MPLPSALFQQRCFQSLRVIHHGALMRNHVCDGVLMDLMMTGPIGFVLRMVDALLRVAVLSTLIVATLGAYLLGGAPKQYELDALGGAYLSALERIEGAGRDLRQSNCEQANDASRGKAHCAPVELVRGSAAPAPFAT